MQVANFFCVLDLFGLQEANISQFSVKSGSQLGPAKSTAGITAVQFLTLTALWNWFDCGLKFLISWKVIVISDKSFHLSLVESIHGRVFKLLGVIGGEHVTAEKSLFLFWNEKF